MPESFGNKFSARIRIELAVQALDVIVNRVRAAAECFADFFHAVAHHEQVQYFLLAMREPQNCAGASTHSNVRNTCEQCAGKADDHHALERPFR